MKRFLTALTVVFAGGFIQAQDLTNADRDTLVSYLEKTRSELIEATKGLSAAQWDFKQATNRWSAAEIVEHIAATEDMLFGNIREKVMTSPETAPADDVKATDEFILKNIPDRTRKVQAPEPLVPKRRYGSAQESLKHFEESRAKTVAFAKETPGLRRHATDSPIGKKFDGYQWLLFIGAHCERHTKQLNEVKADPGFPKS